MIGPQVEWAILRADLSVTPRDEEDLMCKQGLGGRSRPAVWERL